MAFPPAPEEHALHQRVLAGDPVVPVDVFQALMVPLTQALRGDLHCTEDEAHDSSVDAILAYLDEPGNFDPARGRLSTYLAAIAKKRGIDLIRSRTSSARREKKHAATVALRWSDPKESMESAVEADELWLQVEQAVPNERDRQLLKLILAGERSTEVLAEALDLTKLSTLEQRRLVKQHRDRLMKVLARLGKRVAHDNGP